MYPLPRCADAIQRWFAVHHPQMGDDSGTGCAGAAGEVSLADVIDSTSSIATDGTRSLINGVKVRVSDTVPRLFTALNRARVPGRDRGKGMDQGRGHGQGQDQNTQTDSLVQRHAGGRTQKPALAVLR